MAVLDPDELLEQAEFLVIPRSPGPPRQVDVRRAISAAYYAVFHLVCIEATNFVIGQRWQREPRYTQVYRSVDHRDFRTARTTVGLARLDAATIKLAPPGGFPDGLRQFAFTAMDRQARRHAADYDPTGLLRTRDAQVAVSLGRSALAAYRQASAESRMAILATLFFKRR